MPIRRISLKIEPTSLCNSLGNQHSSLKILKLLHSKHESLLKSLQLEVQAQIEVQKSDQECEPLPVILEDRYFRTAWSRLLSHSLSQNLRGHAHFLTWYAHLWNGAHAPREEARALMTLIHSPQSLAHATRSSKVALFGLHPQLAMELVELSQCLSVLSVTECIKCVCVCVCVFHQFIVSYVWKEKRKK